MDKNFLKAAKNFFPLFYAALILLLWFGFKELRVLAADVYSKNAAKINFKGKPAIPQSGYMLGTYRPELPYSFESIIEFEGKISSKFSVVSIYQAWGSKEASDFNPKLMDAVVKKGYIPMITWEPWVTGFSYDFLPPMSIREDRNLKDIANGLYDDYVKKWARAAAVWGKPVFLRFAHEMNYTQYPWAAVNNNTPADFTAAWRHVYGVFKEENAANVSWVWSPKGYEDIDAYYPGGEYVDWVGTGIFNYGAYKNSKWWKFHQMFGPVYAVLRKYRKPLMIAELGCVRTGGIQASWYEDAFKSIGTEYRDVKLVVFFDNPSDRTFYNVLIDWSISNKDDTIKAVRKYINPAKIR
jgi:hypothetical protein